MSHIFLVIAIFHRLISVMLTWQSRLRGEIGSQEVTDSNPHQDPRTKTKMLLL